MKYFLTLLVACFAISNAVASSIATPAQVGMGLLKNGYEDYADAHSGQLPPNLEALPPRLVHAIEDSLGGNIANTIFVVENSGIPMIATNEYGDQLKGTILAVIASPVKEDRRHDVGRYVVWREEGGRLRTSWFDESIGQKGRFLRIAIIFD